jgi:hypothetical protein
MKELKASIIKIAETVDGKQLFAIYDEFGLTSMQVWDTLDRMKKIYTIV